MTTKKTGADTGAICGGVISWTKWKKLDADGMMANMMCLIRKKERYRGKVKYKIIDPLGNCWWWEDGEMDAYGD